MLFRSGWSESKMYPFMYNPVISISKSKRHESYKDNIIKFLYVGRFYYKTKGIDTLMKASTLLKGNWTLDLVGGYGKDCEKVIKWANGRSNVNYIGSWNSVDVCTNMRDYDVVVVPSKYDGWNLLPNEAIHAGIATIVTDQAVSDELIKTSNAGLVVPAANYEKMAQAMQTAIDRPDLVKIWKNNTLAYKERISSETVAQYIIDILDYHFYDVIIQPKCPWINLCD